MNANLDFDEEVTGPVDVSAPAEEAKEIDENPLIAEFADNLEAGMSPDDLILWLRDSQEISFPSAVRLYAELKKAVAPEGDSKSVQVSSFIKTHYEQGYSRAQIIQLLQDKFEYSPKSAASMYSTAGKTLGILSGSGRTGGSKVPMSQVVSALRSCPANREAYVAALMDLGYSESTAGHFVNYIPMAKEWAKQEAN